MCLDRTQLDTRSIGILDTHSVGILQMSDQPITEGATYITHEKGMPSVEFEPATLTIVRQQAYASETMATGIGPLYIRGTSGMACLF